MKAPDLYTAEQVKNWDTDMQTTDIDGRSYWIPARPYHLASIFRRMSLAWGVFVGKYDALWWND